LVLVARTHADAHTHTYINIYMRARARVQVYVGSLSSKASNAPAILIGLNDARWNKNERRNRYIIRVCVRVCRNTRARTYTKVTMSCREAAVGDGRSRNTAAAEMAPLYIHTYKEPKQQQQRYLSILNWNCAHTPVRVRTHKNNTVFKDYAMRTLYDAHHWTVSTHAHTLQHTLDDDDDNTYIHARKRACICILLLCVRVRGVCVCVY